MITSKITRFSNLIGREWWRKDELGHSPKYENIKKSYDALVSDIKKYLKHVVMIYGTLISNEPCSKYELSIHANDIINITLYGPTIYIRFRSSEIDFPVIHDISELTLKDLMELIEIVEPKIKDMTPRKIYYF